MLLLTKRLLNETIGEQLPTLLSAGAAVSATARTTEAAAEGLAAFLEKRRPCGRDGAMPSNFKERCTK